MKIFGSVFALLGVVYHVRVYKVFSDPVLALLVETIEKEGASVVRFLQLLAIPWIPFLYYLGCLIFCFLPMRNRMTMACGVVILAIAVPYFVVLFQIADSSRAFCLFAGGAAIYNHLLISAPNSKRDDSSKEAIVPQ